LIGLYKHIEQSSRWATRYLETYTALSNTVTLVTIGLFPSANSYCPHFFSYCPPTSFRASDSLATLLPFLRFFLHILFRHFFSLSSGSTYVCLVSCLLIFTVLPYSILNSFFLFYVWTSRNSTLDPRIFHLFLYVPKSQFRSPVFTFKSGRPKIPLSILDFSHYQFYTLGIYPSFSIIMWLESEANHLPPSFLVVQNTWSYILFPMHFFVVWCLMERWNILTFNFVLLFIITYNFSSFSFSYYFLFCFLTHSFYFYIMCKSERTKQPIV